MTRRKTLEHRCEVPGGIVVGHAETDAAGKFFTVKRNLGLLVQVQHAPGIPQQLLPVGGQLQVPWTSYQQLPADGALQLLYLHAHRRLGAMHLFSRARQRARVDDRDETFEPVDLQVTLCH
ncbi:hypothetical protein D9M69_425560 [compost metagenome]